MPTLDDIRIRDPFILADGTDFYLFGTTDQSPWIGQGEGFDFYRSTDLVDWEGPFAAFRPPLGFWGTTQFWAPEVHRYQGRYFMFATFADGGGHRGTQVLVSDSVGGPYEPWSTGPVTPWDWQCLDGTLHLDDAGLPWIVFCHEWLQTGDGSMYAQRLTADLRAVEDEPHLLFRASEAPWTLPFINLDTGFDLTAHITDGPWLRRGRNGDLLMLWSSGGANGYAIGLARSRSGAVTGPWTHETVPVWPHDGGHGMVFETAQGLMLAFHAPNDLPRERVMLVPVTDSDDGLTVGRPAPASAG